ncbi:MAG: DUF883 domain-containing protein [Betaproteobacteria bacterium]|jgi:ElaB/YqjD/DUF883 family membrane-anchored ribosome-binding protein|uniref:DUF883 domain-containing protein n=1 Tax=Thiomonas delicata TaxID=364030 RepID=A0A238D8E7_THIDL|nr:MULTISPECIES: DUF883 family protein [Thiomonas]MDE2128371.1 DUF883 domain-containing protein [Betaproteobacteria bacterium]OZB46126.1 MAG: hypothetical protein B7X46_00855 [Thiomonas sp. 15-66-11]OZB65481.1 MAG: hypothetical protein B7X31_02345 [Thiomonas sp. 13-66-29]SBP89608.1 conserved hypothetical protein [Thiomonas delicata]
MARIANNNPSAATDKLVTDLKEVASDAEELLKLTAGQAGEKIADVRGRLSERLSSVKSQLVQFEAEMLEKGKEVARVTDQYVHDNPWKSIGATAGVAFLLGLLIGRR